MIDPRNKYFTRKLYRHHLNYDHLGNSLKDLLSITKDLSKIIIVDNLKDNFQKQLDNGILIDSFYTD
jgi:TFIIF-interacting CTD phosphatase-like protein